MRTLSISLAALAACSAMAGPFTAGNFVVSRVGDGVLTLNNSALPVFLDEYTPAGVLVQSVPMPTAPSGNNKIFTDSGTATSSGGITRSDDKKGVVMTGYDAAVGTVTVTSTASAVVNRVVGWVKADGTVDTSTNLSSEYSGNNFRCAATVDGSGFWTAGTGTNSGVRYITYGPGNTSTQLSADVTNTRMLQIFGGQLFVGTMSGAYRGVNTVGTGLPTTSVQIVTLLPGFSNSFTSPQDTYAFQFVDANTLYIACGASKATVGGLQKFTFDGANWNLQYTITAGIPGNNGLIGLVVMPDLVNGNKIIATTFDNTGLAPSQILSLTDSGTGLDTFTTIVTAPSATFFRGLAPTPEASAQPVVLAPTAVTVGLGQNVSGGVTSFATKSDSNVAKFCKAFVPNFSSPRIRIDLTYLSPYLTPSTLQLDMTARMTTGGSFKIRGFLADTSGSGTFTYGVANQVIADTSIALSFADYTSGPVAAGNHVDTDADASPDGTIVARSEIQQTGFSAVAIPCAEWDLATVTVTP